jgi:hypothetical protein
MNDWLHRFVHKKKIAQFHLNGSSSLKASGKDKHEVPFSNEDLIWRGVPVEESGFYAVIQYAKIYNIPVILEINRGDPAEILRLVEMVKGL